MKKARYRALTHSIHLSSERCKFVEMKKARYRALTHILHPAVKTTVRQVEMKKARYRELTHFGTISCAGKIE